MRRRKAPNQLDLLPNAFRPMAHLWFLRLMVCFGRSRQSIPPERMFTEESLAPFKLEGLHEDERETYPKVHKALKACLARTEAEPPALPAQNVMVGNLQRLATLVGLNSAEVDILAFLLLGRQLTLTEQFLDRLGPISASGFHSLLAAALKLPIARVQRALAPAGRLSRSGLVHWDLYNKWDFANKVDLMPGLYERLSTVQTRPYGIFAGSFIPAPKARLEAQAYTHLEEDLATLRPYLQEAFRLRRKGVNILLHGRPGGGKTQFARMLAADLGCDLFEVATETEDQEPITGECRFRSYNLSQTILRKAPPALVLFDEVEDVFRTMGQEDESHGRSNRSGIKAWVNRTLEENPVPSIWITNKLWVVDPAFRRRFDYVLELDVPPRSVRGRVLNEYLRGLTVDPTWVTAMAEHQDLVPAVVERAASVVRLALAGNPGLDVGRALPRTLGNTLEALGATREVLGAQAPVTRYRPEILNTDCDLAALIPGLRLQGSGRLCLYGPPGTGKSAFGQHLAKELDRPLLVRRASDLLGMYVGENEKNIAAMFAQARQERAILLLDEADSFLQDRKGAQKTWELTLVNEMLTQMEAFPGIFIASTNLMATLEPAALRRFDLKVRFDFLRPDQARLMFGDLAQALGLPVDAPALALLGATAHLTPGDFAAVANQVHFRPAVTARDLAQRLSAECALKPEARRRPIGFPAPIQDTKATLAVAIRRR